MRGRTSKCPHVGLPNASGMTHFSYPFLRDWRNVSQDRFGASRKCTFDPKTDWFWPPNCRFWRPKTYRILRDWKVPPGNAFFVPKVHFLASKMWFLDLQKCQKMTHFLQFFVIFLQKIDFLHKIPVDGHNCGFWAPKRGQKCIFWHFWTTFLWFLEAKNVTFSPPKMTKKCKFCQFFVKKWLFAKKPV